VTSERVRAYIALGSNVGDRAGHLAAARRALAALPHTAVLAESAVEETEPLGGLSQPPYLNQMVLVETALSARRLLEACLEIERASGRVRSARWEPRPLDLDIVRFGDHHIAEPGLTVPHPGLPERDFWQRELAELESHDV
jgi:2-amino-4-hydroxy-6-hydroxymethyldihydropteridine diphosphokinase